VCHYCLYYPQYTCFKSGIICKKQFHAGYNTCTSVQFWNVVVGCEMDAPQCSVPLPDAYPDAVLIRNQWLLAIVLTFCFVFLQIWQLDAFSHSCEMSIRICPCFLICMFDHHTGYTSLYDHQTGVSSPMK
jgi:hypothetical protein